MKMTGRAGAAGATVLFVGLLMLLLPESAMAGDPEWRPVYDVAMRWVNFLILVAVIVKYGREPIKDFLKFKKEDMVAQIDALDSEKARILDDIKAAQMQGEANQVRFKEMKQRLIAQGETRKQQIIEQAKQQSAMMLEETRRKMENRIVQAKAGLKVELLDMAIDQATKQLPGMITDKDSQRLLDEYMSSIRT
jgi:F-type H+-transporting ATPase subunit b